MTSLHLTPILLDRVAAAADLLAASATEERVRIIVRSADHGRPVASLGVAIVGIEPEIVTDDSGARCLRLALRAEGEPAALGHAIERLRKLIGELSDSTAGSTVSDDWDRTGAALLAGHTECLAPDLRHPLDAFASLPPHERQQVLDARNAMIERKHQEGRSDLAAAPARDGSRKPGVARQMSPAEVEARRRLTPPKTPWVL